MGNFKKEASRKSREGKSSDGMANVKVKGENFYRNAKQAKHLRMTRDGGGSKYSADGSKVVQTAAFQSREIPTARIEPNRKWFGNTRVISQEALAGFREAMAERKSDPYSVLMKRNKLPMSLLETGGKKEHEAKIKVENQPFSATFGPKAQRKRPKIAVGSVEEMAKGLDDIDKKYQDKLELDRLLSGKLGEEERLAGVIGEAREPVFSKGTSKRIWNELYKVIDSSDVILHVLDARDPLGTRCHSVEKYMREEAPHKHLIFVLNKCDLVPTSVAAAWVRHISKEHPCLAFHANINNSFGKGTLIGLLRQFSSIHSDRRQISVGLIGYPNSGKSSIINTLRKKKVCTVAPIPGETKVWQYITLMKRIYLIDCPGIVPPSLADTTTDILLRGSVRVENVEHPEQYIQAVLDRCKPKHIERTYEISGWTDSTSFLEKLARKGGRLLKGGEADLDGVAKMVLNDFLRGKLPWFIPLPKKEGEEEGELEANRTGRLGEMRKRKAEGQDVEDKVDPNAEDSVVESDDEDFGDDGEEWGGIEDSSEDEDGGVEVGDDDDAASEAAPTLVAESSDEEVAGEETEHSIAKMMVKSIKKAEKKSKPEPRKKRKT